MKRGIKTGGEIVERYCPRLDKNVSVYRNVGEKTGYTCTSADMCDIVHCMMSPSSSKSAGEHRMAKQPPEFGSAAVTAEI